METKIIDERLEDEQQIVTYKYLTEKLDIHPNKAKQILKDYVSKLADDKKYSITIAIGGIIKENDEFCIVMVYNDHLETVRRRFKHINFEHLYSIQPINRFDDINNALYLVDSSLNNHIPSSIKKKENGNIATDKQNVEISMETDSSKEVNSLPIEVPNHNSKINLDKVQNKKTELNSNVKTNKNTNAKPKETEVKSSPKKANSDFFTKFKKTNNTNGTDAKKDCKVPTDRLTEETYNKTNKESPKKTNSDMFTKFKKSINSNDSDSKKNGEDSTEKLIEETNGKINVESPKKNVQEQLVCERETKNNRKSSKKRENSNKKKKENNKKIKRKRIQTFDDSSDEEIDSEEEDKKKSENIMDVDDEVDIVQPTPPRPTPKEYRKKEKKTTTSTFIDDDGFVCTTKEIEVVETECELLKSVDNGENSVTNELNVEPATKKIKPCESDTAVQVDKKKSKTKQSKNTSTPGMKQSSLTSFFKRQ